MLRLGQLGVLDGAGTASAVRKHQRIDLSWKCSEAAGLKTRRYYFKNGDDSHVFLFLAWTDSSKRSMYLIHETGNSTNNVMVGTYNIDWPFYRNLLGEE